jgi:hypothetical protein
MEAPVFSRRVNAQYRWTERLLTRIRECLDTAVRCKQTQAEYLEARSKVLDSEKRLTRESAAYVRGYLRALESQRLHMARNAIPCFRRIVGRPETATSVSFGEMTPEMQRATREGRTETCLMWDVDHPYTDWKVD